MDTISFKTISANKNTVTKNWVVVDADGQNLGRLASKVAILLRGKHKTNFTPHVDCGDNVIVINSKCHHILVLNFCTNYTSIIMCKIFHNRINIKAIFS